MYRIILLILWNIIFWQKFILAVCSNQMLSIQCRTKANKLFFFTGNGLSIAVLYRQDMDLKPVFKQILITLISFDTFCIVFNLLLFCFSHLSIYYYDNIFPYIVPYILPLAQIALTGKIINLNHFQIRVNVPEM